MWPRALRSPAAMNAHVLALIAAIAGVVLTVAGCGSTTNRTVTIVQTTTVTVAANAASHQNNASGQSAPKTASSPTTASSGAPAQTHRDTLTVHDFHGDTVSVTAEGIIDPARPANPDLVASAGTRLVAVELALKGEGPGTISSDANSNTTVIGSDSQAYTFSVDPVAECTSFSNGEYTVLPGDAERGCVVFQLPAGVTVKSVQFSLGNGTAQFNNG